MPKNEINKSSEHKKEKTKKPTKKKPKDIGEFLDQIFEEIKNNYPKHPDIF